MTDCALLDRFAVLRTRSPCAARSAVAQRYCDHKLSLRRGRHMDMRFNHLRGAHLSLNLLGYGADVHIDPGQLRRFYLLQIPLAGRARVRHRREEIEAGPERATILNPDRPTRMDWGADCVKLMLQIDVGFLNRLAAEEAGAALPGPVRFDPGVDLTAPGGGALRALILATARAYESGALDPRRQGLREHGAEHSIVRALLEWQPSNVSHILARTDARRDTVVPKLLRRAVDFIHDSYDCDLRLEDIAAECGLHPRTLQAAFRDTLGIAPMAYLKTVRLDMARYRLAAARHDRESVTDVAYGCGFTHLGRFAQDYRSRFGHSPRDTI